MTPHEILVAARNLIDREGFIQGQSCRGGIGPYCTRGAVMVAVGASAYDRLYMGRLPDAARALDVLAEAVGPGPWVTHAAEAEWPIVESWSEWDGRTKAEVLAAFDKAITDTAPEPADPFPITDTAPTESVVACSKGSLTG